MRILAIALTILFFVSTIYAVCLPVQVTLGSSKLLSSNSPESRLILVFNKKKFFIVYTVWMTNAVDFIFETQESKVQIVFCF